MAATNESWMDVPSVTSIADTFNDIGGVLNTVSSALEVLSNILSVTAFIGLVGGAAVARIIDIVKPEIDELAEKCEELSGDLKVSVEAFQNVDEPGGTRFY